MSARPNKETEDGPIADSRYVQFSAALLEALNGKGGIERLLRVGLRYLDNPLKVNDLNYKTLAFAANELPDDPHWAYLETSPSYMPDSLVSEKIDMMNLLNSGQPKIVRTESTQYEWAVIGLIVHGEVWGSLTMTCVRGMLVQSELEMFALLGSVICIEIERMAHSDLLAGFPLFLDALLKGNLSYRDYVEKQLVKQGWIPDRNLFVVIAKDRKGLPIKPKARMVLSALKTFAVGSPLVGDSHIVMLALGDRRRSNGPTGQNAIYRLSKERGLDFGLSEGFLDPMKAYNANLQALAAINLGPTIRPSDSGGVYRYEDYWYAHLLHELQIHSDIDFYLYQPLLSLIKHDKLTGTKYESTIRAYIASGTNLVTASKILHIHRNTLIYRLGKIKELIEDDVNDPNVILRLQTSFLIGELKKELSSKTDWI